MITTLVTQFDDMLMEYIKEADKIQSVKVNIESNDVFAYSNMKCTSHGN